MHNLIDLANMTEEEALSHLTDYQVAVKYVESKKPKGLVLYTEPEANEFVYDNQMITLYVSKKSLLKFENLENQIYDDCLDYLIEMKEKYGVEVIVSYVKNSQLPDGLIYKQTTKDDYLEENDRLELTVISNPKTVSVPNFVGWYYIDVLKYANENNINVEFEYISILFPKDYVVGQSILEGELVYIAANPIIIYLSKEN